MLPPGEFLDYIKDKRVALVGPSSQTEIMKIGKEIDSYDIVARVGHYIDLVPEEIGSRTDILCENFWIFLPEYRVDRAGLIDLWASQGTKWVMNVWCRSEGLDRFEELNASRMKLHIQPEEIYKAIRQCEGSPTKGMSAIWEFLSYPISELFLVGFSCQRGFGYRLDRHNNKYGIPRFPEKYTPPSESIENIERWLIEKHEDDHHYRDELEWISGIKDKRIRLDPWLSRLCG